MVVYRKFKNRLNESVVISVRIVVTYGEMVTGKEHKRTRRGLEILTWVVVTQVSAYVKVHGSGSLELSSLLYVWDISIGR